MKIAFFELEGWEEAIIRARFSQDEIFVIPHKLNEQAIPEQTDFDIIAIFVDSHITVDVLAHFPKLKMIVTRSTGFDHIDLEVCAQRNIAVTYVPGYGENTVAEFAFGLLLNLTRKLYQAIDQIKETGSFSLVGLRGVDLKGKTLGVVGTGRIGKEMIRIAKGFAMEVVAYDAFPDEQYAQTAGFRYLSLENLLQQADVITFHCPYNKDTHHLLNQKNMQYVKKGAYIVNTARGGIIETEALVMALQSGQIAGVALDVLEEEGEIKEELHMSNDNDLHTEKFKMMVENHILMRIPNVLITPHNAFNSEEALLRILTTTFENIEGFRNNKPVNLVPHA